MAIQSGSILSWADIQTLYTNLNTGRTKFGFAQITIPSNPGTVATSQVQTLNDYVNGMASNKYLTTVAVTGVTVPSVGTLIYPLEFSKISTTINNINDTCPHDAAFFANNNNGYHAFNCNGYDANDCNGYNANNCNGYNANNCNGYNANNAYYNFSNNGYNARVNYSYNANSFNTFR